MIVGEVEFWDLGRNKAKGKFGVCVASEDEFNFRLLQEFSKHLISSEIQFSDGQIFAGFRNVGKFKFEYNRICEK